MISFVKRSYIALGLDVAPRGSFSYQIHVLLRVVWRILRIPFTLILLPRYYKNVSRYDKSAWFRIKSPFLVNRSYPSLESLPQQKRSRSWYQFEYTFTFSTEHVVYNIDYAIQVAEVKGFALVYFMGMGDYFFTTPLIAALRQRYPNIPIVAYVSKNACGYNAPMTATLLQSNPHIAEVIFYDGQQRHLFKNYDYQDALRLIPEHYLALPVLYEHLASTKHRVASLFKTFGLSLPVFLPKPLIYVPATAAPHVTAMLHSIQARCSEVKAKGVVFLQLDARSSDYHYAHTHQLVKDLNARGFFVVVAGTLPRSSDMALELDFKLFTIIESIHLLKLLRDAFPKTYVVSVTSVFWPISSGLGIPNLGMYHFVDPAIHSVWYPNIYVVTHHAYDLVPMSRQFLAHQEDYELNKRKQATFKADFVMTCFDDMRRDVESNF